MTGIAFIAYVGLNLIEDFMRDQDDPRLSRLLGNVASDVIKFFAAAGIGVLAGAAVGAITTLAAGPVIAAVLVGIATSIFLDRLDRQFGLTEQLVGALEAVADRAQSPFRRLALEIARWERAMINRAINNSIRYR